MFYNTYEFLKSTKIVIFKIENNDNFILPDTAVINFYLENGDNFTDPIIELFPITPKLSVAFAREAINGNTSNLPSLIKNSNLNKLFPNLFSTLTNNKPFINFLINPYKNNQTINLEIYKLTSYQQIKFINNTAINQALENIVIKE